MLLLHGGPGGTHEYLEAFDSHFPAAEIEYTYYDQLGSTYSDQPDEPELWTIARFVEEIEQVRRARHLDASNFYLYGHSWGGILALEYALTYQQHLKGLIISNIMASIPAADAFCASTLLPAIDPGARSELEELEAAKDYENPRYGALVFQHYYLKFMLRMPPGAWPEPLGRMIAHRNLAISRHLRGPSAFTHTGPLAHWDRTADLGKVAVPTLTIGATYDFHDPAHVKWMAEQVQHGRYLHCPNGSHVPLYDDPEPYFEGIIRFIEDVDAARF